MSSMTAWQALKERVDALERYMTEMYRLLLDVQEQVRRLQEHTTREKGGERRTEGSPESAGNARDYENRYYGAH